MARITDPTKLEGIKKATMELVVKYGYRGTSIGAIARKAGVSTGYLYRHYNGKSDLIDDLIESNFKAFQEIFSRTVDEKGTARDAVFNVTKILFELSINEPINAKFLSVLVFDQNSEVRKRRTEDRKIKKLVDNILELGIRNDEINPKTTVEEIILILFPIIFSYISSNLIEDYDKEKFGDEKAKRITEICLNAWK
ncbi:MAG: TetR/AcrR family transcriptional regulator [Clostridia bacterium]|nr:TetR/AcrR family transcriptional regulator [Clostridia bacterium]